MYNYNDALKESIEYFGGNELAAKVFLDKYALRDNEGNLVEKTPDQMHRRIAKEFARVEKKKFKKPLTEDEIFSYLDRFKYIIPQGSPMYGIGNSYQTVSLSNCYVVSSPLDSYGSIVYTDQELAQISKRRGGVGVDVSNLRPEGAPTKNAARSSTGIISFMERYSNTIREVGQAGRRGALMISLDVRHPQSPDFAVIKNDNKKITGANISLRLCDEFLDAVEKKEKFKLRWPVDSKEPSIVKEIDAKELWKTIIHSAWLRAEPGILFWDNIKRNSPADCYEEFQTISTNPCIVGETLIAVADGRNAVSIKQLTEEGKDVPVYSTNTKTGQVEIRMGRNPRKTGDKKEIWKLILDDGSYLLATPNHRILKKDLSYCELKDLKIDDSLYPFYSFNSNGYRQISNVGKLMSGGCRRNRRQYRVIYEFYKGIIDPKVYAIHHKDINKLNDGIDNLECMLHEIHRKIHSEKMMGKNNPYHKMTDDWKKEFASHPGKLNPKYIDVSNEEILEHAKKLFSKEGKFTRRLWMRYAKKNGLPQCLWNDFRFKSYNNFKNQVCSNHKVKSVEFYGYEDVYNITVDNNNNYHIITSYEDDPYITSSGICVKNCGEVPLSAYDSCRLLLVNLYSFVDQPFTDKAKFNFEKFHEVVGVAQRLMDDLIDLEIECIEKIIAKVKNDPEPNVIKQGELDLWKNIRQACLNGRRTGTGITALGDCLAALGIKYGSDDSIKKTEKIYRSLKLAAYRSSVDMAKELGAFSCWDGKKETDCEFIKKIKSEDEELYKDMMKYGRRNVSLLTTAPAGSVSILTKTTSGIEPLWMLEPHIRRKKINPSDKDVRVDFVDQNGDSWQEYKIYHPTVNEWMKISGEKDLKKSPWYKCCSEDLDWKQRVKLQAAAQKHVDHSISSTVNLPEDVTEHKVAEIYEMAWKSGCKGITIYRANCRTGVLVDTCENETIKIQHTTAPKRPKSLPCDIHHIKITKRLDKIRTFEYIVLIGLINNSQPYEVFAMENGHLDKIFTKGYLVKHNRGHYSLMVGDKEMIPNITKTTTESEDALTRMISCTLRHGAAIEFVMQQLEKSEGDIMCFSKAIARTLKKYIKDGTKAHGEKCDQCQSDLIFSEGCKKCPSCGWSKCG